MIRRVLTFGGVCVIMYAGIRLFDVWGALLSAGLMAGIGTLVEAREKRRGPQNQAN